MRDQLDDSYAPGRSGWASPWTPWIFYGLTLLSFLPIGMLVASGTDSQSGGCSGVGFGCSLHGSDAAGLLLLAIGIPYATALLLVLALAALLPPRLWPVRVAIALIGLCIPWVFAVAIMARVH